jgi:hypothetical protein
MLFDVVLGAVIGGSVTFLVAAMLVSGARQQILIGKGTKVTYKNSRGKICHAVVGQNVRTGDDWAVLEIETLSMPFIVNMDNVSIA